LIRLLTPLPASQCLAKRTEFKLLQPRFVRLSDAQRREAVVLLADLLLSAVRRRAIRPPAPPFVPSPDPPPDHDRAWDGSGKGVHSDAFAPPGRISDKGSKSH
jgi:hypothetical protein